MNKNSPNKPINLQLLLRPMNSTTMLKQNHKKILTTKSQTNQTPTIPNEFHKIAEANLMLLAEDLHTHLTLNKTHTLDELNTISAIIHKYTTSYNQLKSIETKNQELSIKKQLINLNIKHPDLPPFPKTPNSSTSKNSSPGSQPSSPTSNISPTSPPSPNNTSCLSFLNSSYGYRFSLPQEIPIDKNWAKSLEFTEKNSAYSRK